MVQTSTAPTIAPATDDTAWFTEIAPASSGDAGCAFSLRAKRVHAETTPFQSIEIFDTERFGMLMTIDGCTMVSTRDNFFYHEMMSHPVLAHHPAPKTVVIIGGGDCGTLREVLRHSSVTRAVQVEIDERVTRLAEQYFPELCEANSDPRAELLFDDGLAWMANAAAGSVDVIIVDSTDPVGPAEGLFNEDFYRNCLTALGADGLLVQQSESAFLHPDLFADTAAAMRKAGFAETHPVLFPQPVYPSGWWSGMIATRGPLPAARSNATDAFSEQLQYYSPGVHAGAMAQPPFVQRLLAG